MAASPSDLHCCDGSIDLQAQLTQPDKMRDGLLYVMVVSHVPRQSGKQSGLMNVTHTPFSVPLGG